MKDFCILDTIKEYAVAARSLEAQMTFIRDEIEKINESDDDELDGATRFLNEEIERRAQNAFVLIDNVFQARNARLTNAFNKLAFALDRPDVVELEDDDDEVELDDEDLKLLAKVDVAELLGLEGDIEEILTSAIQTDEAL